MSTFTDELRREKWKKPEVGMTQIKNIREHIKILDKKTNYIGLISDAMKASGEVQREYKEVFSIIICGLQK